MLIALVYEFPPFESGLSAGVDLLMTGGDPRLLAKVAEHSDVILEFKRVRCHEFPALYNYSAEQVNSTYFKLVGLDESDRLAKYVMADQAASKAYTVLHHFRVFPDEDGCHGLFAESVSAAPGSGQPYQAG